MRVLVVDDSIVFRSQIKTALENTPNVEVVGVAGNGRIALQKLEQTPVDLVTLDLEMPVLDGISTLKELRKTDSKTRVIVFSSQSTKGSKMTLDALSAGADDFVAKPSGEGVNIETAADKIKEELLPKILQFVSKTAIQTLSGQSRGSDQVVPFTKKKTYHKKDLFFFKPSVALIGSSTGGPPALEKVFEGIRAPLRCPILIAQHMPPIFTRSLANRIHTITGIPCEEGKDGETLENRIYVAPGDFHMTLKKQDDVVQISLNQGPQIHSVRPAVDPLFESAAKLFGADTLGIILTGMGEDGRDGCVAIKSASGGVMIQNRESCVVYGMPGAVDDAGAFDTSGTLEQVHTVLRSTTQGLGNQEKIHA